MFDENVYESEVSNTETWINLNELSRYLNVSVLTVKRLHKEKGLPLIKIGHEWRAKPSMVDNWLKENNGING